MAPGASNVTKPVQVDGRTLEGGGQLFRLALCLSSLSRRPIYITEIRGNRAALSKGGQDGGIKPAHLAGASWLAGATQASTHGLELKSRSLLFQPALAGNALGLSKALAKLSIDDGELHKHIDPVWKDIREAGSICRRETNITMLTPGSVFLILQAILPHLLFSSQPSRSETTAEVTNQGVVPLRIVIKGGTNVWNSLSAEYAQQVLFPMLQLKVGISVALKIDRRGWSMGSKSIGKATFNVTPLKPGCALPPFSFSDRGAVAKIHVSVLAPSNEILNAVKTRVSVEIEAFHPSVDVLFDVTELSGHHARLHLLLVAETSNGYRLGRDWLYDRRVDHKEPGKTADAIVKKVVRDLDRELEHGGCVDKYLQDQLTVFQALAKGTSTVHGGKASLHTDTTQWVCEKLLGVSFDEGGHCEGVGFIASREECTDE